MQRLKHQWRVTPAQGRAIQDRLRGAVRLAPLPPVSVVAGLDCAFSADRIFAAAVVWDLERGEVLETRTHSRPLAFPYVPGLLSFREAPALLGVLRRVQAPLEALLCDGQGLAHPRRFGLACHLGVLLDLPAVGCAKSRLVGEGAEPGPERGASSPLTLRGERVGAVLRTKTAVKPVFVSPGHRCDIEGAVRLALQCGGGFRLPEPVRLADKAVAAFKRRRLAWRR